MMFLTHYVNVECGQSILMDKPSYDASKYFDFLFKSGSSSVLEYLGNLTRE